MGGSAARASFGPLVAIICHIVRCMHTESTSEATKTFKTFEIPLESDKPPEPVSTIVFVPEETKIVLASNDMINLIMSCEYECVAYSDALAHLCFGNKRLTKQICSIALNVITVSDFNRIGSYLELIESQLEMDDVD